jgi:hypothetical protein
MTMQTFTVIASNEFGEASVDVSIDITDLSPKIVVPVPSLKWTKDDEFTPVDFAGFFDGPGMKFSSDDLPDGFVLTEDGVLSRLTKPSMP